MQLFSRSQDNGSSVPWELENEWVFTVSLEWQTWLFGVSRHGDSYSAVWSLHFGPLAVTYYHRN